MKQHCWPIHVLWVFHSKSCHNLHFSQMKEIGTRQSTESVTKSTTYLELLSTSLKKSYQSRYKVWKFNFISPSRRIGLALPPPTFPPTTFAWLHFHHINTRNDVLRFFAGFHLVFQYVKVCIVKNVELGRILSFRSPVLRPWLLYTITTCHSHPTAFFYFSSIPTTDRQTSESRHNCKKKGKKYIDCKVGGK